MTKEQANTKRRADEELGTYCTVLLLAILGLGIPGRATAQDSPPPVGPSLTQLAAEMRQRYGPVRFHREEDLEDQLVVRPTIETISALNTRIYLIQAEPFDISNGSVIAHFGGGLPTMYVGTSQDGKSIYKLAGFDGAEEEFRRLVRQLPEQAIRAKNQAESRGRLCAQIVYGLLPNRWVNEASSVKLMAASHFFDEAHEDGLRLGERWWKGAKGNRELLRIDTVAAVDGYTVSIPVFSAPVEVPSVPEVRLYKIGVGPDGSCQMAGQPIVVLH